LPDATERICHSRLKLRFPEEYEELKDSRIRFLKYASDDPFCHYITFQLTLPSVWRPLSAPFQDCPLAMCDGRTVDRRDLVAMDIVYPHFVDEAYEVLHNTSHRWFYKQEMKLDDVIILKLYDNQDKKAGGVSRP
jgi:hypothetical protein